MTDPVNTDALRAISRRLARSVADQWVADAQDAIPVAADEVDRLRAIIATLNTTYDVDNMLHKIRTDASHE